MGQLKAIWSISYFSKMNYTKKLHNIKNLKTFTNLSVLSTIISTTLSQILHRWNRPSYWCNDYSQFTHTCYNFMESRFTSSCQVPVNIKGKSRWTNYHLRYHQWSAKIWVYKRQIWHKLRCQSEGGSSK